MNERNALFADAMLCTADGEVVGKISELKDCGTEKRNRRARMKLRACKLLFNRVTSGAYGITVMMRFDEGGCSVYDVK